MILGLLGQIEIFRRCEMDLKVFKVDDCDWIVAHSLEEATEWYKEEYGDDPGDYYEIIEYEEV